MSDIFVKTTTTTGWRKASNIFVKTTTTTGWKAAVGVWIRNLTQWVKVWPLAGIFATRVPYIGYFSSDTYANRMPNATYGTIRIGDSYFGDNAVWDLNGWAASSYTYRWKLYDEFGQELGITLRSGTGSGWTSSTGEDQLPTSIWTSTNSTNSDRKFLGFEVTANNSSNSQYNGVSLSTKIQVLREKPILSVSPTLSNTSPNVGSIINYSSGWNTAEAYKPEAARTTIRWYRSTSNGLTASQLEALTPIQTNSYSYTVVSADNSNYIYAMEEVFNSGTDFESLTDGVTAVVQTTSLVATAPNAFTYSISNVSSVTTPNTPTQTRVSSTSNDILFEFASSIPSDTLDYTLNLSGPVTNAGNQSITLLNIFSNNSDYQTTLTTLANNSAVSSYVQANGTTRTIQANVSTTSNALSWAINCTMSGAIGGNGTYTINTNSMPATIAIVTGAPNPTVTINSVTAYSGLNQTGSTRTGTAGSPTSLSSISRPTATSGTSTSNYTFYSNNQLTGSQRRVTLPSAFTSGTTIYISTNGYINWGGSGEGADPAGLTSIPALSTSGITVAPLAGDLRQGAVSASGTTSTGGLWTFADSTNYWVTWWGNYYQDAAQVARYQVKFYWGQSYADIYIVNNSLTTITPSTTAVQNGANVYQNWSGTTSQTSVLLSTASMNRISTWDGADDNRTAVVASAPVLTWTVTWNAAGGTGGGTTTLARGLSHTAPTPGTRDGFDFSFYRYPASGGTDPVFVSSGGSYTPTQNVEFGAIWTTKTYTVSYNANGGTGAPSSQTKTHGVALTLSSTTPTRANFTFNGWNTAADGTGTNYSSGGSYTVNAAVTLYAKWLSAGTGPSGGSVTLTPSGTQQAGTTITANVSAMSGTATISYTTTIRKKTGSAPTSSTDGTQVASGTGTGSVASHTITALEASGTPDQFRAFTTGTNSISSNTVASNTVISTPAVSTPATQPGTPGTPTNGWTGGTTYPFSWTAPGAGTVAGGGAATINNYSIIIYEANNAAGTGAVAKTPFNTGSGSSSYTYTSPNAALYYAASVAAINSAGLQGPYSGISQYK